MRATPFLMLLASVMLSTAALGHGDVAPQPVDTDGLPENGDDWLEENPYRAETAGEEVWAKAVKVGASGYNQNCARCHGLEGVSGGLAPDLRYLEANFDGDEWYVELPAFGELLGQDAAWAIRTYVETRPDDGALDDFSDDLKAIRDDLVAKAKALGDDSGYADIADEVDAYKEKLSEIAVEVATASGAPVADSAVSRAVTSLDGSAQGVKNAAESLTVGMSAAQ